MEKKTENCGLKQLILERERKELKGATKKIRLQEGTSAETPPVHKLLHQEKERKKKGASEGI